MKSIILAVLSTCFVSLSLLAQRQTVLGAFNQPHLRQDESPLRNPPVKQENCFNTAVANDYDENCSNFDGYDQCRLGQKRYVNSTETASRRFQTPPRYSDGWRESYQDYGLLQGYSTLEYYQSTVNGELKQCVTVKVVLVSKYDSAVTVQFGDQAPTLNTNRTICQGDELGNGTLKIQAFAADPPATLVLEDVDFLWNVPAVQSAYNGKKGAIVELFGWPYAQIALECSALSKAGYLGVKIWPPNEHVSTSDWLQNGELNPWWFMYQPVSYKLHSRMGTRDELRQMIYTCRQLGVRVYADAVINHMSGNANDIQNHRNYYAKRRTATCAYWGAKDSPASSPYFTHGQTYQLNPQTGKRPALEFPAVPYKMDDFHCERPIEAWDSPSDLNFGWLFGLSDLATEKPSVRARIAAFLTEMLSLGISGFRIDAAKHMDPRDVVAILALVKKNLGGKLPGDFLVWLEVIMSPISQKWMACELTAKGYNYYEGLNDLLASHGFSQEEVASVKLWASDYPSKFPLCGDWIIPPSRFVIQNDDHDQESGKQTRQLGNQGSVLILDKNVTRHRLFETKLFQQKRFNADIRLILSSYSHMSSGAAGIPDGQSDCSRYTGDPQYLQYCLSVPYQQAHDETSGGYDILDNAGNWLPGRYTRTHRDKSIISAMRDWMGLTSFHNESAKSAPDNPVSK